MKLKALVLAACLTLAACAGTPFSFDDARQVKLGMSEEQVTALMGRPYMVASKPDGQVWIWSYASGLGGAQVVSFKMADGHVTEVPNIPSSF
jgi:outer membrane protein assembly factor BamE (lipoprotein component of BamABCDE complex)